MIIWHDVEQGSPEWKELRKPVWTGSSAIRLLQDKLMLPESDWYGNDATLRGKALEYAAIREYERKYHTKVQRPGFVTNTVYPNAGFSPDGIDGPWLLECKALLQMQHEGLISDKMSLLQLNAIIMSRIPLRIKAQVFFGMIITGKRKARLLAFNPEIVGAEQLIVIEIGYDRLIGDNIRRKLRLDIKNRRSI